MNAEREEIRALTSVQAQNWNEPMLPLFRQRSRITEPGIRRRLFLIPSRFDEDFDPNFSPVVTPQDQLPEITIWVRDFTRQLLEVMSSRRSPQQLARWCHRTPFASLVKMTRSFSELPKVRRVHIRQPLESLAEVTVIYQYRSRVHALMLRFEGIDKRWLCTLIERLS